MYSESSGTVELSNLSVLKLAAASTTIHEASFFSNTGTVEYDGHFDQSVARLFYYNLTTSGSGTKSLSSGTTTIENALTTGGRRIYDRFRKIL